MNSFKLGPYLKGYASFHRRDENPYPPDSPEFLEWIEGCYDAQSHQDIDILDAETDCQNDSADCQNGRISHLNK